MKYRLQLLRVTVAIVLTMVVSVLPHHHHHGVPCCVFDECLTHQHTETCPENDAASTPCNDNSCYLQAMRVFTMIERADKIHPILIDLIVPDVIAFTPIFYNSHHHRITSLSYPLHSGNLQRFYLRGPPVC